jgi:hypothetical protein
MGFRKQDRSLLAHWLKRQKQVMREKEEALEEGKMWFKRAKLAHDKGERELAQKAHERAAEAKRKHDKSLRELESIAMELETLRSSASDSTATDSGAAARAEQITENFERMGIDTDMAALENMAERADADQALSNLRNRLGGEGDRAEDVADSSETATTPLEKIEEDGRHAESVDSEGESPAGADESSDLADENAPTHRDSGLATDGDNAEKPADDGFRLEPLGEDDER